MEHKTEKSTSTDDKKKSLLLERTNLNSPSQLHADSKNSTKKRTTTNSKSIRDSASVKMLPNGQRWFINKRHYALGYSNDVIGRCLGVACEGIQAFLEDDPDSINRRYQLLNNSNSADLRGEINRVRKRVKQWSIQAKTAISQEMKLHANESKQSESKINIAERLEEHRKQQIALNDAINFIVQQKIKDNLTREEQDFLEMDSAAQTVEIHHQPWCYPEIFNKNAADIMQDVAKTFPLMMSHELENQGGIECIHFFTGIYDKEQLRLYFHSLREAIEKDHTSCPTALLLKNYHHAVAVKFQPKELNWIIINPAKLPYQIIQQDHEIADEIYKIFTCIDHNAKKVYRNGLPAFQTTIYGTHDNLIKCKSYANTWVAHHEWKEMHKINHKKTLLTDVVGNTWLYFAVCANDKETVLNLLDKGANPDEYYHFFDATPLKIAFDDENNEMARLLKSKGAKLMGRSLFDRFLSFFSRNENERKEAPIMKYGRNMEF